MSSEPKPMELITSDVRAAVLLSSLTYQRVIVRSKTQLYPAELQFINIVAALSDGAKSQVQALNKQVSFTPGALTGGKFRFNVDDAAYIAEFLILLLPFCRYASKIELWGNMFSSQHSSIWYVQNVLAEHLRYFCAESVCPIKFTVYQYFVELQSRPISKFSAVSFLRVSPIVRIFGVSVYYNVPKAITNRVITAAKQILQPYISDCQISQVGTKQTVQSYGLSLFACSENYSVYGVDFAYQNDLEPEDVGIACAKLLLAQIEGVGAVDCNAYCVVLLAMALSESAVSVVRFSRLSERAIECMRVIFEFTGVQFQVQEFEVIGDSGVVLKGVEIVGRGCGTVIGSG